MFVINRYILKILLHTCYLFKNSYCTCWNS